MLKHIVLLASLASLATLFGCATETAPEEETAKTEGRLLAHEVGHGDPQESDGNRCARYCKNFCNACQGECRCGKNSQGDCEGTCTDIIYSPSP
ncbi:MAG: hypothetical protein U0174_22805 [Polyangiaceae bacterium]